MNGIDSGPFTAEDLAVVATLAIEAWSSVPDAEWASPAGTLDWSRFETADHTIDCVFSYAFFFASRAQAAYPSFGEVHALDGATPEDLVAGIRAMTNLLIATITVASPDIRAIIWRRPEPTLGSPNDFAARGAHEFMLHTHDICTGTDVAFDPPRDVCQRLVDHTAEWPYGKLARTSDPWSDLLARSGRARCVKTLGRPDDEMTPDRRPSNLPGRHS